MIWSDPIHKDDVGELVNCDGCGENVDAVYPMAKTYWGRWFEIKSNMARNADGWFCYGCCDALENGGEWHETLDACSPDAAEAQGWIARAKLEAHAASEGIHAETAWVPDSAWLPGLLGDWQTCQARGSGPSHAWSDWSDALGWALLVPDLRRLS
jgi:hypothetical protein